MPASPEFLRRNKIPQDLIPPNLGARSAADLSSPTLILNRYSQAKPGKDGAEEKKCGLQAAIKALENVKGVYENGFNEWIRSFNGEPYKIELRLTWDQHRRVIVGFGETNVLESGISLLQPYGVPYIPGSALKGLAAHYCGKAYGKQDERFKIGGVVHNAIFGSTKETGAVLFHDAWLDPESVVGSLRRDVLTAHHQSYNINGKEAPSDFDSPNPVAFLSAAGTFKTFITLVDQCVDEKGKTTYPASNNDNVSDIVLKFAVRILREALENDGVGGKTNSNYGFPTIIEKKD